MNRLEDDTAPVTSDHARPAGFHWQPGVIILLLGGVLLAGIWLLPILSPGHQSIATAALAGLMILLTLGWLAFFAGLHAPLRVFAAYVAVIGALFAVFRAERFSGDVVPTLTWRWAKKKHQALADAEPLRPSPAFAATADLLSTTPDDYPRFLGSDGRATVSRVALERDWENYPPKPIWRQPIGAGWSSFAVVGQFAVTQELRGEQEMISCYRVETGERVWTYIDPLVAAPFLSRFAGDGPRATPTIYEGFVYAVGSTGVLNCLDGATGQLRWARNVLQERRAANVKWGISCSPLVYDERVVVTCGAGAKQSLAAYDRLSGKPIADWDGGNADNSDAYCSPMIATLCDVRQILILNDDRAAGHDPVSGEELWSYPWPGGSPNVVQPVPVSEDQVFVTAGYSKGCVLLRLTPRTEQNASGFDVTEVWKPNKNLKAKFSNVIVHEGHVYGFDEGVLACVDLANGKRLWRKGRYGHGQLLKVGDLILLQQEEPGDLVLVEPTPDPDAEHEIARIPALAERTWNNPVLAGRHLLIRNDREAACFEMQIVDVDDEESSPP